MRVGGIYGRFVWVPGKGSHRNACLVISVKARECVEFDIVGNGYFLKGMSRLTT